MSNLSPGTHYSPPRARGHASHYNFRLHFATHILTFHLFIHPSSIAVFARPYHVRCRRERLGKSEARFTANKRPVPTARLGHPWSSRSCMATTVLQAIASSQPLLLQHDPHLSPPRSFFSSVQASIRSLWTAYPGLVAVS